MDLPTTPRQSRKGLWIALSVVVALVAGCVGGIIAMSGSDRPAYTSQPTPSISWREQPSPTPSKVVTITLPAKISDRARITNSAHQNLSTGAEKSLRETGVFRTPFAAFYGTTDASKNKIYLFGGLTTRYVPADEFDRELKLLATVDGITAPTELETVSAGSRPGVARCANTTVESMPTALCGWSDAHTFVVVMWYNRTVNAEIKAEMIEIRDLIEIES